MGGEADQGGRLMRPLAIDLFCGLGGWTEGLLAEGYRVVGFDVERHVYGEAKYPAQLVLQDVLTLHGSQFKTAALIVASPPCQEFSYMAMPWSKAKTIAREYLDGTRDRARLTALFDACFRIQREASAAAGHHIPLVVENVCGAQKWVGRARWHYGSFYLWGDVPALMPIVLKHVKVPTMGAGWYPPDHPKHVAGLAFNGHAERAIKNSGGSWFAVANNTTSGHSRNPLVQQRNGASHTRHLTNQSEHDAVKGVGLGSASWQAKADRHPNDPRNYFSKSSARKAASAQIAKIPMTLSRHIARVWHPEAVA